jgi:bla regulator protein BlaR1
MDIPEIYVSPQRVTEISWDNSSPDPSITGISRRRSHAAGQKAGCLLTAILALSGSIRTQAAEKESTAVSGAGVATAEEKVDPSTPRGYLVNKLNTIKLPVVTFDNTSISEALDYLRMTLPGRDNAELDPAKKGLNLVIRRPRGADEKPATLKLDMKDVTLRRVLDEIAKQSGLRCRVDDYAVALIPADEKDPPKLTREQAAAAAKDQPPAGPKSVAHMNLLRTTVLPVVDFQNVSLAEAVAFLNARAKDISGGAAEAIIKIRPNTNGDSKIAELRLRNVPLFEVVKYCAEAVNEKISVNDDGLQIGK